MTKKQKERILLNRFCIENCSKAINRNEIRSVINGVVIYDKGKNRFYIGTNGFVLVKCKTKIEGPRLPNPLKINPVKFKRKTVMKELWVDKIGDNYIACKDHWNNNILLEMSKYEDMLEKTHSKVIPKHKKVQKEAALFNPDTLKKVRDILGVGEWKLPFMESHDKSALWETEKDDALYQIVAMPMRLK